MKYWLWFFFVMHFAIGSCALPATAETNFMVPGGESLPSDEPAVLVGKEASFQHIHLTPHSTIGRLIINDRKSGISEATWIYVKAAIDRFIQEKPACVILELNTPGGEVFAAQRISHALRSLDTKHGIPVIAYVNNWAISAGAMLAYSCRYIVVAPDASMGAATPVFQTSEGMEVAPEKVNSALRTDFANRASFFDRNPDIARAMVDSDVVLVRRGGKIMALVSEDEILKDPAAKDEILSPKGKLLTLTAEQMRAYGVADWVIPKEAAGTPDEDIDGVIPISETPFRTIPGFSAFSDVPVETFQMDMKTTLVSILASPVVSSILVFVAFVCFYIEMSAPGVSLPGIVGGIAVFLLLVGSFAQEAITWFEPLCIMIGLGVIALELTFFPTLGVLLVVGGALVFFGTVSLVIPGIESVRFEGEALNAAGEYVLYRLGWLSGAFLLAVVVIVLLGRYLSLKTLRISGIILENEPPQLFIEPPRIAPGDEAVVIAALRPAGKIEYKTRLFDAVSGSRYIEEGTRVRVIEVRGSDVFVEPLS